MIDCTTVRLRRWSYALGTSVAALAAASASPASAQCAPDPTIPWGTTNCSGTDEDGIVISSSGTQVVVARDAIVRALAGSGNAPGAITVTGTNIGLTVNGLVDGGARAGIALYAGPRTTVPCDPYAGASIGYCPPGSIEQSDPWVSATVTVAEGATVTGTQALLLSRDPTNVNGSIYLGLSNSGTMTGTQGPAIVNLANRGSLSIANEATGRIDGMVGRIDYVRNNGLVEGGVGSAIAITGTNYGYTNINNQGRILSAGAAPTLSSTGGGRLYVDNAAGAVIGGNNGVAIYADGAMTVENSGTILGSIVLGVRPGEGSSTEPEQGSVINTRSGRIEGDVLLGASNDTVRVLYDIESGRVSSITGRLDGGDGEDTLALGMDRDATLSGALLPNNFERLGLDLSNNAAVTLAPTFTTPSGIALGGVGTLYNQADLSTTGAAVAGSSYSVSFVNSAKITASLTSSGSGSGYDPAETAAVRGIGKLENSGSITAVGGAGVQVMGGLINSGTITATGTAARLDDGSFDNVGTIVSTGGVGARLQSRGSDLTNAGTIRGATTGLELTYGQLVNTGTIAGNVSGVSLGGSASLVNAAGSIVENGIVSIGSIARVANAGTINGNVIMALPGYAYDFSEDLFVDEDGIVNGTIMLGGGDDELVVDLVSAAGRSLAGATGGVEAGAGYDTLRYRVNADAAASLALSNGFEGLAYELGNNAALTLSAPDDFTSTLGLTGSGTVTLEGAISTVDRTLIDARIETVAQRMYGTVVGARDLTIVNNGALSLAKEQPFDYWRQSVIDASGANVVNNGSITVTSAQGSYYPAAALFAAGTVTNTGSITVNGGGSAIDIARAVTNSGTITGSGNTSAGLSSIASLDNSGTIRFDGTAVEIGYSYAGIPITITNSGTIESTQGTAVSFRYYGYGGVLTNAANGIIRGTLAVDLSSGGTVVNRGAIVGDVGTPYYSYMDAAYVADGGTLEGDLLFGAGNDIFVTTGSETGVTGVIDGGDGDNAFGYALAQSGSVSLVPHAQLVDFDNAIVLALGPDTVATVTAAETFTHAVQLAGTGKVVNTATISGAATANTPWQLANALPNIGTGLAAFENQGTITGGFSGAVANFANVGSISSASAPTDYYAVPGVQLYNLGEVTVANSGVIANGVGVAASDVTATNSGTITGGDADNAPALQVVLMPPASDQFEPDRVLTASLVNSGMITGAGTAIRAYANPYYYGPYDPWLNQASIAITNTQSGSITGEDFGIAVSYAALTLENAGTIKALPQQGMEESRRGYAVVTFGEFGDTIRNTGTLDGAVLLDNGDDRVENSGTIAGPVNLGMGDDTFVQRANAVLGGIADGGDGTDRFVIDATGDGALEAGQIIGFEQVAQTGTGTVRYSGSFKAETIDLLGGTLAVAAGQTLATAGAVTVTGGDGGGHVINEGTIAGAVHLGAGSDSYLEGVGSLTWGGVDGGEGVDLYRVALAGDRAGIGARMGFEQLSVEGSGTLNLTLDQDFQSVALTGTNLTAALNGFTVGRIDGSDAAEQVLLDSAATVVTLGGGNDALSLGAETLAGRYEGGTGIDMLRFTAQEPVTLTGAATGFETVILSGSQLTVAGTLGSAGASLTFTDNAQSLVVASGGTLAGAANLGAGNDSFRLAAGGTLAGTVDGGTGLDTATFELGANAFTLSPGRIAGFEHLRGEGTGTLVLAGGAFAFDTVASGGGMAIGSDAVLTAGRITLGSAGNTLAIAGGLAGSVAGGAGQDTVEVAGLAAFTGISDVETLRMSAGYASISGDAALRQVVLNGGRLVGLAGSRIGAASINVGQGATFGSAGTVDGNITVAGTLSPGASPGTMTVNGNVVLTGTSVSVFEITPTTADTLVVNGNLSIAEGATLQILADQAVKPGRSLDLITATGGITGSFSTIVKPASLFGFVVQREGTISLLGQFLNNPAYSGQVRNAIDYVNDILVNATATDAFLAAVPVLVNGAGETDQAAFAKLTPEAYASAGQIVVEQGLELAATGRSDALAPPSDTPGSFTFASALGSTRTLEGGSASTAQVRTNGYGFLGGLGWSAGTWSIGGFVGYLDSHQTLSGRGASTEADAIVGGIHARWNGVDEGRGPGVKATIAYSGGEATTHRALPGGRNHSASSDYNLRGWTADVSVDYAVPLSGNWTVRPGVGVTAIRTTREGVMETGGDAFALDVRRERDHAVFVDGAMTFRGGLREAAVLRPYLSIGVRYQIEGRSPLALAALGGGALGLEATSAARAPVLATATIGADLALSSNLSLFGALSGESGDADNRASARTGLRLAF